MRPGQQAQFALTFPADYPAAHTAGRTAQFEVTLKGVEAVAAAAGGCGISRARSAWPTATWRACARNSKANLEREVTARLRARTRDQVFGALLQAMAFEVPHTLVEEEVERR